MLKTKLAAAVLVALCVGPTAAFAHGQADAQQDTTQSSDTSADQAKKARKLETITVTGSLIPQTEIETATPVTTITAQDIKARGFATVAEALKSSSFSVGSVQGQQSSASFTQGAETLSFFGLPVGYVKYLINGKPMGNFPALYNGSDAFNSISGIPADLVDHIDILPGGQSSLYGSDAIAGVINIVLKKSVPAPVLDVRYGWHSDGGGNSTRISLADTWNFGKLNVMAGLQHEHVTPIWGYDRDLTSQFNMHGTSAPVASRDVLVMSAFTGYISPSEFGVDCSTVSGLFHGTEGFRTRPGSGEYCGSFYTPGYRTLTNSNDSTNLYTHATFDASDNVQLYGDFLYNYSETKYTAGSNYTWWGTADYGGYIYDANRDDFVLLQRAFAPEDMGGYDRVMDKQIENSYMLTLGANGTFGESNWDYDLGFTHSDDKLHAHNWNRFSGAIDAYFEQRVLGQQQGLDPYFGYYPRFANPDYAAFYQPIDPADFWAFSGFTNTNAKTWDNLLRGQITNASLFSLPGGDAGIAVVAEGGNEGWDYTPDPRLLDGSVWGTTDVQGAGHRSRYAVTSELRLPVFSMLTFDISGRRDDYKVAGDHVAKNTYNIGLEFRPFETLLVRGRYGTAFKAPTLADQFQGMSGYYSYVTDYYSCSQLGYGPSDVASCPAHYNSVQFFGQQAGNDHLQPINAKVWSYGVVWAPFDRFSVSADYYHTDINNEVSQQSADGLMLTEYQCRTGILDINSPTCQAALSQITRSPNGDLQQIFTPKVNVSNETNNAIVVSANWAHRIGSLGDLHINSSYSDILKHTYQQYPGDPTLDLLRHPGWSSDFKSKANLTVGWNKNAWGATIFVNRYGSSPNYAARATDGYTATYAGRVSPWILYNASVDYTPVENLTLSFRVNNLFNKMPPADHSYPGTSGSPYNSSNYDVFGRAMYLEANYKFGK